MPTINLPRTAITGTISGIGAFLAGYALTYLWLGRQIESTLEPIEIVLALFQAEPIGTWRAVGWFYYGAHFVDLRVTARLGFIEATTTIDLITQGDGNLQLLYLLPLLLLLIGGFLISVHADAASPREGLLAGGSVILGYGPVIVIGWYLVNHNGISPDLLPTLFIAGVVYPVILGSIGGFLATRLPG